MDYDSSQALSDSCLKFLVGIKRSTFEEIVKVLR